MKRVMLVVFIVLIIFGGCMSTNASEELLRYKHSNSTITLVDYDIFKRSNKSYLVLYADFACNEINPSRFLTTFSINVYQNGIGCDDGYFFSSDLGDANTLKEVKDGATIRVYVVKELNDTISDVEVHLGPWISFLGNDGVTGTFPLNKGAGTDSQKTSPGASPNEPSFMKTPGAIIALDTKRSTPANIGDTVSFEAGNATYVELTLEKVISGDAAAKIVKDANFFNASPGDGMEYCLAYFNVCMQANDEDKTFSINENDFDVVSATGKVYEGYSHSVASIDDSAKIFAGGSADFVVPIYINKGDIPLLLYDNKAWFSTDDSLTTRATAVENNEHFSVVIPDGAYVIHEYLYIGMDIDEFKNAIKEFEGIEPDNEVNSDNGIGLEYSNIACDVFGYKSRMLVAASPDDRKVKLIVFLLSGYSLLAQENVLDDYDSALSKLNEEFGAEGALKEWWDDNTSQKQMSKLEGTISGKYNAITTWTADSLLVEIGINVSESFLQTDIKYPLSSVIYCDPEFVKLYAEQSKK